MRQRKDLRAGGFGKLGHYPQPFTIPSGFGSTRVARWIGRINRCGHVGNIRAALDADFGDIALLSRAYA
jgi:hypothetical protein